MAKGWEIPPQLMRNPMLGWLLSHAHERYLAELRGMTISPFDTHSSIVKRAEEYRRKRDNLIEQIERTPPFHV